MKNGCFQSIFPGCFSAALCASVVKAVLVSRQWAVDPAIARGIVGE
jgi:hypothetical protein